MIKFFAQSKFPVKLICCIAFRLASSTCFLLKVGLSPSKKKCVICLNDSPINMMKNAFYFILKALFVLKLFSFLSRLFGHVGKTA